MTTQETQTFVDTTLEKYLAGDTDLWTTAFKLTEMMEVEKLDAFTKAAEIAKAHELKCGTAIGTSEAILAARDNKAISAEIQAGNVVAAPLSQINMCDGTGACADGKCLRCQLVNLQLTNDTLQARVSELLESVDCISQRDLSESFIKSEARVKELEQQLNIQYDGLSSNKSVAIHKSEKLEKQLLLANAQIVVKDEALKTTYNWIGNQAQQFDMEDRVAFGYIAMIANISNALTNSPAAAKELIARMERMEKALTEIASIKSAAGINLASKIAQEAITPTNHQPTKE